MQIKCHTFYTFVLLFFSPCIFLYSCLCSSLSVDQLLISSVTVFIYLSFNEIKTLEWRHRVLTKSEQRKHYVSVIIKLFYLWYIFSPPFSDYVYTLAVKKDFVVTKFYLLSITIRWLSSTYSVELKPALSCYPFNGSALNMASIDLNYKEYSTRIYYMWN